MNHLTVTLKKWLVAAHILFSVAWVGASFCYLVLATLAATTGDVYVPHAVYTGMRTLSESLVFPAAAGAAITGVWLSALTSWGLLKWWWIIVKFIATPLCILLETVALGSLLDHAIAVSAVHGPALLRDPAFLEMKARMAGALIPHLLTMSAIVVLSVIKPWGQRKAKA